MSSWSARLRGWCDRMAQPGQFALDPSVPPAGILAGQPHAPHARAAGAPGGARHREPAARGAIPVPEAAADPAPLPAVPRRPAEPVAGRASAPTARVSPTRQTPPRARVARPPGRCGSGPRPGPDDAPPESGAHRGAPPREVGSTERSRWSAVVGGLHSVRSIRRAVRCIRRTGAPVDDARHSRRPHRTGVAATPLTHPMRAQRVTAHRMGCTRCTPLTRCAAGFHPGHRMECNPCPPALDARLPAEVAGELGEGSRRSPLRTLRSGRRAVWRGCWGWFLVLASYWARASRARSRPEASVVTAEPPPKRTP